MPKALYRPEDRERVVQSTNKIDEKEKYRSCWRRDYARLIHSAAFRRLQGKTQLFPGGHSDFFRNRLTHSLEVAQIAKSIAIMINATYAEFKHNSIDTDLVETAALAHDLGHPPFGHNGEAALNDCMKNSGGFEGNAQTLRILAKLEKRETRSGAASGVQHPILSGKDNRAGLNLTFRTLAAKRVICDFIAGMTDRYAVQFYGRLFGTNPESIFAPL
jgi:dGTPase